MTTSKFADIKVGDRVGIGSSNANLLRHYRYESGFVSEVTDETFRTQFGWFSKDTGRGLKRSDQAVSLQEMERHNTLYHAARVCVRRSEDIERLLQQIDHSPETAEMLTRIKSLLEDHLEQSSAAAVARAVKEDHANETQPA